MKNKKENEPTIGVTVSELSALDGYLCKIIHPSVEYRTDQLEMANVAIRKMKEFAIIALRTIQNIRTN